MSYYNSNINSQCVFPCGRISNTNIGAIININISQIYEYPYDLIIIYCVYTLVLFAHLVKLVA